MNADTVYGKMAQLKVIPVIAIESADSALGLADALLEGGLPIAEVTFRTAAAPDAIAKIRDQRPEVFLGAGTLLTPEQLHKARDCGAVFGVAPGLNPTVLNEAVKAGFPFSPGIMTPSEIEAALEKGVKVLKFFPAGAAGGPGMLKSIAAPYAHTGVRFIPTGGVSEANLGDYLSMKSVLAVGGTWIASKNDIAAGNWQVIIDNCKRACDSVAALK